jgi:hypothetical protein
MRQLNITFQPGLSQKSRSLRDHLATQVYSRGLTRVAGRLDMAPSKLTEKLAGVDSGGKTRGMTIDELEDYIAKNDDLSPIYYLIEKYLHDEDARRDEAMAQLAQLAQSLPAMLAAAGFETNGAAPRRRGR